VSQPARRRATYEDLLGVPDHLVAQIVDGELITSPRPASRHAFSASALGGNLHGPFQLGSGGGPGGWWIVDEPELHLGADILVPDLAGWRRERMPVFPDVAYFELAPDWICEVLSPSTARLDRARKLPIYAREGVAHAWLVDPGGRTLEVLRLHASQWLLIATFGDDDVVRSEPFEAVELALATLWIDPAPTGR
jgi:Uma2 family endonuclease